MASLQFRCARPEPDVAPPPRRPREAARRTARKTDALRRECPAQVAYRLARAVLISHGDNRFGPHVQRMVPLAINCHAYGAWASPRACPSSCAKVSPARADELTTTEASGPAPGPKYPESISSPRLPSLIDGT